MNNQSKLEAVKARLQALRAMTIENGCTEHEAMVAAQFARKILHQHGLSVEDVQGIADSDEWDKSLERLNFCTHVFEHDACLMGVAAFFDCRVWSEGHSRTRFIFLGLSQDVHAAVTLAEIVGQAMTSAWRDYELHKRILPLGWRDDQRQYARIRAAFMSAMARKVSSRLAAAKRGMAEHGTALIVLKQDLIARAMRKLGVKLERGAERVAPDDFHASVAGARAGERVDIANPRQMKD